MKYQLVLQFRERWPWSYHFLVRLEDQLIASLGDSADVDGHDCGSGEMNIFIYTDDPNGTFTNIRTLLARKLWVRVSAVAYREVEDDNYTILWPEGSQKPFIVT